MMMLLMMMKRFPNFAVWTFFVILAFATFGDPVRAIAQQTQPPGAPSPGYYGPGPWHMWSDGYAWPMWWIGPVMMFLFLLVMVGTAFFLFRGACGLAGSWGSSRAPEGAWRDPNQSALQILNERFAKGEIPKEEYAEKKAAILGGASH